MVTIETNAPYARTEASPATVLQRLRALPDISGAAVAMQHGDGFVCDAAFGVAPPQGTPVNPESKLSAECIRTRKTVYCRDTEEDVRAKAFASDVLRSILIVPVCDRESVIGLIQIYSAQPYRFGFEDFEAIEKLAAKLAPPQPEVTPLAPATEPEPAQEAEPGPALFVVKAPESRFPFSKPAATGVGIVASAVLLAAFVWSRPHHTVNAATPVPVAVVSTETAMQPGADLPESDAMLPAPSVGSAAAAKAKRSVVAKPDKRMVATELPVELAKSSLKIVPVYAEVSSDLPDSVELSAKINPDGSVQEAHAVNGPANLRQLAEAAVRQWRYKPQSEPRLLAVRVRLLP